MRILWLKTELLHPVDKGGRIRTYEMLRGLARSHEVTYVCLDDGSAAPDALARSSEYATQVVRVPFHPPARGTAAFAVDVARSLASPLPYALKRYKVRGFSEAVARMTAASGVDVLVCDFLAPAVNVAHPVGVPSVLFQHNVEAEIWRRHAEVPGSRLRGAFFEQQWRRMARFEGETCRRFDHVVAVSDVDAEYFTKQYGTASVSTVATGVDTDYFRPEPGTDRQANAIVFVGSMDWMPNEDAVEHFAEDVLPLIQSEVPGARFQIVGRRPGTRVQRLADRHPGVEVTGSVPDVRPYLASAALMAVPLRVGGGTRLKIFEAMAMGCPVVSTAIGAEGLPVEDGRHFLRADSPEEQAAACISLLRNRVTANELAAHATAYVRQHFSWTSISSAFATACEATIDRRRSTTSISSAP